MILSLRNIFLLSAAAVSAANAKHPAPQAHQLDASYTFEQYLAHFDKSYDDPDEYDRRSNTFDRHLKKILRHNVGKMTEAGDVIKGYVMGVNMFTDVETEELPMGYNKALNPAWSSQFMGGASSTERMLGAIDTASYSKPPAFKMEDVSDLLESIDWEERGKVNPQIPQQGGCGSCWTFAATATIESHLAIANGDDQFVSLSEQNMLQCTPNPDHCGGKGKCDGATVEIGLNYIADMTAKGEGGMFDITDVPYTGGGGGQHCKDLTKGKSASVGIDAWTKLPTNDYEAVMNAVAKVGPLAIAVAAGDWGFYEAGIFDGGKDATVNHAVLLVGYGVDKETGEKYYKVRNSWGSHFGEDGYIRLIRTDDEDNNCIMDTEPLLGLACALDDNGNTIAVEPVEVCGTSAILFDVSYPTGVRRIE